MVASRSWFVPGSACMVTPRALMIISASYKTDIPAFYGDCFINRLRLGHCRMRNPWGGQLYDVPLDPESVDGFVFWTRNIGPFLHQLDEVRRRGYPFVVQYTITGYPRELERSVQDAPRMMRLARQLADEFGPHAVVWRYDPILSSSLTSREFHLENFSDLARGMEGVTTEVVISYTHFYRKTRRNLDRAAALNGFAWNDEIPQFKRDLTNDLAAIARRHGMRLSVCSQQAFMSGCVQPARCVDAKRLSRVAGCASTRERRATVRAARATSCAILANTTRVPMAAFIAMRSTSEAGLRSGTRRTTQPGRSYSPLKIRESLSAGPARPARGASTAATLWCLFFARHLVDLLACLRPTWLWRSQPWLDAIGDRQ